MRKLACLVLTVVFFTNIGCEQKEKDYRTTEGVVQKVEFITIPGSRSFMAEVPSEKWTVVTFEDGRVEVFNGIKTDVSLVKGKKNRITYYVDETSKHKNIERVAVDDPAKS